jgi:hypothetical protein
MPATIFETVTIPEKKGIKIQCKCGNIWIYCGKNQNYCSCSKCRTTITIKNKKRIFLEKTIISSFVKSEANK